MFIPQKCLRRSYVRKDDTRFFYEVKYFYTMNSNEELIHHLKSAKILEDSDIKEALRVIDRKDFVLPSQSDEAYLDAPLPIGHGQTISQPTTVVFMLELLDIQKGDKVLDVGSGSGWTSALLSYLTGKQGSVTAVERIEELLEFGDKNASKYDLENLKFVKAAEVFGYKKNAPYDKILVSASAKELPEELADQLNAPGTMVIPVGNSVLRVFKNLNGKIKIDTFYGFSFVPLIEG